MTGYRLFMADPANRSSTPELLALTAQIVAAHVAANTVPVDVVSAMILSVHGTLVGLATPALETPIQEPAVPIKRSIQPDYLICLEDGAKVKMLARYVRARFGLTPDAYRVEWGLPRDYPMVAPGHYARRSVLAKQLGSRTASQTAEQSAPDVPHLPIKVEEPTAPVPNHTAASVFANFPAGKVLNDKPGRNRIARSPRPARRRPPPLPM